MRFNYSAITALFMLIMTLHGCGDSAKPTAAAKAKDEASASSAAGSPAASTASETSATAASNSGQNSAEAKENLGEPAAKVTDQAEQTNSAPVEKVSAKKKDTKKSDKEFDKALAKQAKKPALPMPTAEQVAKWGIVEAAPLQLLTVYDGYSDGFVHSLAVSPDGKQFVVGGVKLTLWNLTQPEPVADLLSEIPSNEIERPIRCVEISPDGTRLAAGDQKGNLRIWTLNDQKISNSIKAHQGRLVQLAFSPDSQKIATTSYSGDVVIWNVSDGTKMKSLKVGTRELAGLHFLTETLLASTGGEATIWDIESGSKVTDLATGRLSGPAMAISHDRNLLAFTDSESTLRFWDVPKSSLASRSISHAGGHPMAISHDGKSIATYSNDLTIRIWDAATGQVLQAIDADGGHTSALAWLPQANALVVASENGRIRIWGNHEMASTLGITPISLPEPEDIPAGAQKPRSSAQLGRTIDIRSFPTLPGVTSQMSGIQMISYTVGVPQAEAAMFYRHFLGKAGWIETLKDNPVQDPSMNFHKDGCELTIYISESGPPVAGREGGLQIVLSNAGNYDARWLPKIAPAQSRSEYSSFSNASYRTKADISELEVAMLKKFHELGWTSSTRLNASSNEEPDTRFFTFHQGGVELSVMIGRPADAADEFAVQTSVHVASRSLPIPPDSGWIEFDNSRELTLVANTKMNLTQTIEFFDARMKAEGWLSREAGRMTREDENVTRAWLPYLRGQQDVLIRLVSLPDDKTRIIVGDAEQSSWQLEKVGKKDKSKDNDKPGLQAADFPLPKDATNVKFDVDQKQILFELSNLKAAAAVEQFVKPLEELGWKRDPSGVVSDEYTLATFKQEKAEVQLRVRSDAKKTSVIVSGDQLLWDKALPAAPVQISYGTWLRRNKLMATLDRLDDFAAEMKAISGAKKK